MPEANQETGGSQGLTEQQAVDAMLQRWSKPEQPEKAEKAEQTKEEPAEEEVRDETRAEKPEGESPAEEEAEQPEADGEIEFDVGGRKFKAPSSLSETFKQVEATVKEIEAGATRKFQEAADQRKAVDTQFQAVAQLQKIAEANADLLADHRWVARRMQQLEGIDINSVDTEQLTRLNAEYNQLQATKGRIEAQYEQNVKTMRQEETKALAAKREHAEKVLSTRVKGWSPEHAKKLSEYAISRGAPPEALQGISEAWMVEILDDAAFGHAMRNKQTTVVKKVTETPKTLSSGSTGGTKSATVAKVQAAEARFKKSRNPEDAAMLLLARSQSRRK